MAEGVDYSRTHSVRALLEILSELVPGDKKSSVKGGFRKLFVGVGCA